MSKSESSNSSSPGPELGLGMLEKAWEFQWAMRFACGVLFLDIALLWRSRQGLTEWSANSDGVLHDLAFLAVTLAAFALVVSMVLPMLGAIVRWIGWQIGLALPSWMHTDRYPDGRPVGYVYEGHLLDRALKEQSDFLLDWHQKQLKQRVESEAFAHKIGDLVFACLVLAFVDWLMPWWGLGSSSLITAALDACGRHQWAVVSLVMMGGIVMIKHAWFSAHLIHYIYYPPLDDEIREKDRPDRERY